ncbi:InlB B-repeat-containing protein [Sporosarcina sp. FSL K6-3457]|uniref:InlB B-repeat-containing protein n=1 Tax=Sporosarcina sp. FSL K6-3457 TaxID=2978204 RepID=UPI0030FBD1AF
MNKKLIRFVAMMMLLFVISLFQEQLVFADDKDYEWIENNDETVTIRVYKGSDTDVIIPDMLDGKTVTGIGIGAFLNKLITSVTFPASLTKIDNQAFRSSRLTTVTFPPGLTSIGEDAFANNRLTTITLPDSLINIGKHAFSNNQLTSVTLPDNLTSIDNYAFATNELTTVKLPKNLKSIGEHAFFKNVLTSLELPPDLTSIGEYAFSQNQLIKVNFPSDLKVIGHYAFNENKLTTAELPAGVASIGDYSFYQNALTSVKLPSDLTSIGEYAFFGNKLTTVEFPSRLKSIGEYAFSQNALTTVKFPSSLTSIGNYTFFKNELTSIELPPNLTNVGAYAFYSNPITTVTLPRNLRFIGNGAFLNDQLTTAKFLSETVSIGDGAFSRHSGVGDVTIYGYSSSSAKNYAFNKGHKFIPYYKVIYNGNGMTSGSEPVYSNPYEKDAEVTALDDGGMQKVGFTFDGWNTLADGTGVDYAVNEIFKMGEEDVTLYAKWILNKYTIEFDSANGSVVNEVTANHDTKISAPTPPVKEGHTFMGWYTDVNDLVQWNFDEDKVGKDMTLYAKWAVDKYTVKFNPNNDSVIDDVDVDYGTKISAPKAPEKSHHTFMGWYTNTDYLNIWDFNSHPVQGNITLYAKWTVNKYTVTFDSKNGSTLDDVIADYATKISIPTAPVKIGYTFSGWYKDASFQSPWDFSVDEVQDHITLHAKWQYTVKFDTDGGSAIVDALVDPDALLSPPPVPTKLGHIFVGWYTEVELTKEWDFTAEKLQEEMTLYAKWTVNTYTIRFESAQGSVVDEILADYDTQITAPTDPMKAGYKFEGWFTDADLVTAWDFTADKVQEDMTLYAKWQANTHTIMFDSQGGSVVIDDVADYDTQISAPKLPTKSSHTFVGWYTDATLTTAWDFATDKVQADMTLYAKWRVRPTPPPTLNIQATMTVDQALTEEQLDGSKLTVSVSDTNFMTSLTPEHFELQNAPKSLTIREAKRISSWQVELTLAFDGTRLAQDHDLGLMIQGAALTNGFNITTNNSLRIEKGEIPYKIIIKEGIFEPTKVWTVKLSNEVDAATVQDALYIVDAAGNHPPATFTSEGNQIFIHPPAENYADGIYTLYITSALKDAQGRSLKEPIKMIFTIETIEQPELEEIYKTIIEEGLFPSDKVWTLDLLIDIDPATLENGVFLEDANGNIVPVTFTIDGTNIIVQAPVEGYEAGTYTLYITSQLKDLHGIPLQEPIQMTFTIESVITATKE